MLVPGSHRFNEVRAIQTLTGSEGPGNGRLSSLLIHGVALRSLSCCLNMKM